MIVVDFSNIAMAAFTSMNFDLDENLGRHMILNSIRMYRKKFGPEYGEMVIATDHRSWRKGVFPQYKYKRKKSKEESRDKIDWDNVFEIMSKVRAELIENFPYPVINLEGAESDDIIAVLTLETQEFGKDEPVMIVASDKDMIQLHRFNNVKQFSPYTKKLIKVDDPLQYRFEHIIKGDSGDGIPNILSGDDTFVEGIRQATITRKKLELWHTNKNRLQDVMTEDVYRNYMRNKTLVDFDEIPDSLYQEIVQAYESAPRAPKSKILSYLIKYRCKELTKLYEDF